MNYIDFRARFHEFACFSHEQVLAAFPGFDRGNYSSWLGKGYIKHPTHQICFCTERALETLKFSGSEEVFDG